MITLTKIKYAGGDETPRFEAVLCWHGKPVAAVSNGGTGGPCRVWWAAPARRVEEIVATDKTTQEAVLREAARIAKEVEPSLFAKLDTEHDPLGLRQDALDYVCMREVELARLAKSLDRACKTKVLLRTPGQPAGAYCTISVPPTAHEISEVRRRYPGHVVLNDLASRARAERLMRAEPADPRNTGLTPTAR